MISVLINKEGSSPNVFIIDRRADMDMLYLLLPYPSAYEVIDRHKNNSDISAVDKTLYKTEKKSANSQPLK